MKIKVFKARKEFYSGKEIENVFIRANKSEVGGGESKIGGAEGMIE